MTNEQERNDVPAWHPRPTCPGRWMSFGGIVYPIRDDSDCEEAAAIADLWYGPIPEPPKCR